MTSRKLNVAVVGCGAIAEKQHIPQLARRDDIRIDTLVDRDVAQAAKLAKLYGVPHVLSDLEDIWQYDIDAAVLALPNHLHAPLSIRLLERNVHVLVEKPMAITAADCDAMMQAAEANNAILSVGLFFRFSYAGAFVKSIVESGGLGKINSFDCRVGFSFQWPANSDYMLKRETAGGGVLIDLGVHIVDLMMWWFGDVESFEYFDDSYGGVEGDCVLHALMESGAKGTLEVSRTRDLRNSVLVRAERGELEVNLFTNQITLRNAESTWNATGQVKAPDHLPIPNKGENPAIYVQHSDFFDAIRSGRAPAVTGAEARRSVALVEACYREP